VTLIRRFLDKLKPPPVIQTSLGPVTEWARRQAAINLALDPVKRMMVLEIIIKECGGSKERGLAEARRRYPESEWP